MSIEKPISTIRKAIKSISENIPDNYKRALNAFKDLKKVNPEFLNKIITTESQGQDIKDKMEPELYNIYSKVFGEIFTNHEAELNKATIDGSEEMLTKVIQTILNEVKKDNRLIHAFAGKKELFNKIASFSTSEMFLMFEDYYK